MKKLLGFIIVVAVVILLAYRRQGQSQEAQEPDTNDVLCTMEYAPVCGEDGNTYSNRCVAEEQNDVEVVYEGECTLEEEEEAEADTDTDSMTGDVSTGDAQEDMEDDTETTTGASVSLTGDAELIIE